MKRQRTSPSGRAGAGRQRHGGAIVMSNYTRSAPFCQPSINHPIRTLADLATVAHEKAGRCQALADAYRALGDRGLANHWRRRMLKHQAIYRAARIPHGSEVTSW